MLLFVTAHAAELSEQTTSGIGALGLDTSGLVFQVVNFFILLIVLYRFVFRPLRRVLEERRHVIDESLKSAADIKQEQQKLELQKRSIVNEARREAESIIGRSEEEADRIQQQAQAAGQETAERLTTQAHAHIAQQVASARAQIKREVLNLVVAATERVLREKIDETKDRTLIEDAIGQAQRSLKGHL